MPYKSVRQILSYIRDFHGRVSEYYAGLQDKAEQERVKMLLDYLRRHEQHFQQGLADYEQDAAAKLLDTQIQYTNPAPDDMELPPADLAADMSVDAVVEVALRCDDELIRLYDILANQSVGEDVRQLFTLLKERAQQDKSVVIRNALDLKEL